MHIVDFLWLPDVVEKIIDKHHVWPEEVEAVFFNSPHIRFVEKGYKKGEDVYAALGQTDEGRYLIVFFILKKDGVALILSARDMDRRERRHYEQTR